MIWVVGALLFWAGAWWINVLLARRNTRVARLIVPALFGLTLIVVWEGLVRGLEVPLVILPAPTTIATTFAAKKIGRAHV